MSHAATNWAIERRGLKAATKIVLWHLCDRHNPDRGCFPSQARLAHDCEMSRSTVQLHLNTLARHGLVRRERSRNPDTHRENPTRYFFAFEEGFEPENKGGSDTETTGKAPESRDRKSVTGPVTDLEQKPRPKNGKSRDRKSVSNPVREPVRETAGARGDDPDGSPPASQEASVEGEALRALRRRERKLLVKWLLNDCVEGLDTVGLQTERLRFPVYGAEALEYVLRQSAPSINRVAGFARWARDVRAGKPGLESPIDDVKRIIESLDHERLGPRVEARCAALTDWKKQRDEGAPNGDEGCEEGEVAEDGEEAGNDQKADDQQTEDEA